MGARRKIGINKEMENNKVFKILVVDDEFAPRKILELLLKGEGYDVATANGGVEALAMLHSDSYDLVTTCIIMPGMNGIELLERIKDKYPDIPVIFISALGSLETIKSAKHFGAFDYLIKPVEADKLRDSVSKALNNTKKKRQ